MNDLPFLDCPERTEFSDECYGALGRALHVAQNFEANCKSVALLLGIKTAVVKGELRALDDPQFGDFVDSLRRKSLGRHIAKLRQCGISDEFYQTLDSARKARNTIAHEIALGIEHRVEDREGKRKMLADLGALVRPMAEGDKLIGCLGQLLTNEPVPTAQYLARYPDEVVEWVCTGYLND